MSKRTVVALAWFAAMWVGYEVLWSLTGVPRALGPVVAAAMSAFVTVDPGRHFWPRSVSSAGAATGRTSRVPS